MEAARHHPDHSDPLGNIVQWARRNMTPKNLTQQTTLGQFASILGIAVMVVTLFGGVFMLAADQVIDQKYARDADVMGIKSQVNRRLQELQLTVEANTRQGERTAESVDSLTLVVLDMQIARAESTIVDLERLKAEAGREWDKRAERELWEARRSLRQLTAQRDLVLARVMRREQ